MRCSSIRASRWASLALCVASITAGLAITACSDATGPTSAFSLTILPPSDSVFEGDVVQLHARAFDASAPNVSWRVSDPTIAHIESDGTLTALRPGTVHVSAQAGPFSSALDLTIAPLVVQRVEPAIPALQLRRGDITPPMTVHLFAQGGREVRSRAPAFTSEDASVAIVNEFGQVRAMGPGTAIIRVTADDATGIVTVGVVSDTTYLLSRFNGASLPVLLDADSVTVNGVREFHEVDIEGGVFILSGTGEARYQLSVDFAEYNVVRAETEVTRTLVRRGKVSDRGIATVGENGSLAMDSELVSPLFHTAVKLTDGFLVHFHIAGSDLVWDLTYQRAP